MCIRDRPDHGPVGQCHGLTHRPAGRADGPPGHRSHRSPRSLARRRRAACLEAGGARAPLGGPLVRPCERPA
eukprot:13223288-Alexandrium_andersonii.AAC.1